MNTITGQRKDSKKHMPPRPGLHPHPVPPPEPRPEERETPEPPRRRPPVPPKGQVLPERWTWRRAANPQQRNLQWHGHRNRMTRSPASKS
jgi:hypothetical protein